MFNQFESLVKITVKGNIWIVKFECYNYSVMIESSEEPVLEKVNSR